VHELSIAICIVDVAAEELARQGSGRIESVRLRLGPLSGVVREALLSAYDLACEATPLTGSRLVIEDVTVEILCPRCRCDRPVESIQDMRCRVCGTPSANVVRGQELEVTALEIIDEQPAAAIG
jgi:hydrogenase nickel incorporation protein HypA/HybF